MADRYEARQLPPVGKAPALWGAWDRERSDWLRVPGPDRRIERFTSLERAILWGMKLEAEAKKILRRPLT
ncbi:MULTISPECIES: hypothetical protein [unclassified Kitasatospora]|uniref:hypothetical protein n=1 Tax=unclassified Kitasatospora TaxID=2633591 RepID=UPI00070C114B|nr:MULTISPECIES: hypothetical protein [unclassified Kitasatospora]KQV17345.1 hypothetical protein ASC99_25875 [Kitasatospora sp. Root107]KRB65565.1 hypothetical protein ASE03_32210 [Kitasatospora sp. Root187]